MSVVTHACPDSLHLELEKYARAFKDAPPGGRAAQDAIEQACKELQASFNSKSNPVKRIAIGNAMTRLATTDLVFATLMRAHIVFGPAQKKGSVFRIAAVAAVDSSSSGLKIESKLIDAWLDNTPLDSPPTDEQVVALLLIPREIRTDCIATEFAMQRVCEKIKQRVAGQANLLGIIGRVLATSPHIPISHVEDMLSWPMPTWWLRMVVTVAQQRRLAAMAAEATRPGTSGS
jgi:hypothetical protein